MAQQILNRPANGTDNSRNGNCNSTHLDRPHSSSSEIELTSNKAGLGQGITKTVAWETITAAHQDTWSDLSERERFSQEDSRFTNVVSVQIKASHT